MNIPPVGLTAQLLLLDTYRLLRGLWNGDGVLSLLEQLRGEVSPVEPARLTTVDDAAETLEFAALPLRTGIPRDRALAWTEDGGGGWPGVDRPLLLEDKRCGADEKFSGETDLKRKKFELTIESNFFLSFIYS